MIDDINDKMAKISAEILVAVHTVPLSMPTEPFYEWCREAFGRDAAQRRRVLYPGLNFFAEAKIEEFCARMEAQGIYLIASAMHADSRLWWWCNSAHARTPALEKHEDKIRYHSDFVGMVSAAGQWEAWLTNRDVVGERIEKVFESNNLSPNLEKIIRRLFDVG